MPEPRRYLNRLLIAAVEVLRREWAQRRRLPGGPKATTTEFEKRAGYGRKWWSKVRRGAIRLSVEHVLELCEVADEDPRNLLGPHPLLELKAVAEIVAGGDAKALERTKDTASATELRIEATKNRRDGKIGAAAALIVAALEREPNADGWIRATSILLESPERAGAVRAAELALLRAILDEPHEQGRALVQYSYALYCVGRYSDCLVAGRRALQFDLDTLNRAAVLFHQARAHLQLGSVGESRSLVAGVLQQADVPDFVAGYGNWVLADSDFFAGDTARALRRYETALRYLDDAPALDRACVLTCMTACAFMCGSEAIAEAWHPMAVTVLADLARTSPEAARVLSVAVSARASGEAWSRAARALRSLADPTARMSWRPLPRAAAPASRR